MSEASTPEKGKEKRTANQSANRAVLVCHCLLDPLTRAERTKKITRDIISVLIDYNISIIQLPCPEMIYGFFRPPCNKEDYNTPEYREHCKKLAEQTAETVVQYTTGKFEIFGLISIGGSPSCGCQRTHVKGEHKREPGIFIEEIQNIFKEKNIEMKICDHELLEDEKERKVFLG